MWAITKAKSVVNAAKSAPDTAKSVPDAAKSVSSAAKSVPDAAKSVSNAAKTVTLSLETYIEYATHDLSAFKSQITLDTFIPMLSSLEQAIQKAQRRGVVVNS